MRCTEASRLIQAEGDGTSGARECAHLREHLARCAACRQARAGHQALTAALAADPERPVSDGFERRLHARLAALPARSPLIAWWRRFAFLASWRLAPALAATAVLALVAVVWLAAPGQRGDNSPYMAEYVQQHRALVRMNRQPASPEQEVVEFSIAQSAQGSISDTN